MKIQDVLKTKPLQVFSKNYRFKKQDSVPTVNISRYGLGGFLYHGGGYGYRNNDDDKDDNDDGMETVDTDSGGGDGGGGDGGGGGGE